MCVYKTTDGKCKKFTDEKHTSFCVDGPCEYEKKSNYDRIRNMSVEEMASAMFNFVIALASNPDNVKGSKGYLEWLESEAETDERKG